MICKVRIEVKSLDNGEVYSIHEFALEAATTLQAVHMVDDAVQVLIGENQTNCGEQNKHGWCCSRPKGHTGPHSWEGKTQ